MMNLPELLKELDASIKLARHRADITPTKFHREFWRQLSTARMHLSAAANMLELQLEVT